MNHLTGFCIMGTLVVKLKLDSWISLSKTCAMSDFTLCETFSLVASAFTGYCLRFNVSLSQTTLSQINSYLEYYFNIILVDIFWSLELMSVTISNFSEDVAHRNQLINVFVCVFERLNILLLFFDQSKLA